MNTRTTKFIVGTGIAGGIVVVAVILGVWRVRAASKPAITTESMARQHLISVLPGWVREMTVDPVPIPAPIARALARLENKFWVFGVHNTDEWKSRGSPTYFGIYFVGPMLTSEGARSHFGEMKDVRRGGEATTVLGILFSMKGCFVGNQAEAVEIAKWCAAISWRNHPDRMVLLGDREVPDELAGLDQELLDDLAAEISAPRLTGAPLYPQRWEGYRAEFCSYYPDTLKSIVEWDFVFQRGSMSVACRPIWSGADPGRDWANEGGCGLIFD